MRGGDIVVNDRFDSAGGVVGAVRRSVGVGDDSAVGVGDRRGPDRVCAAVGVGVLDGSVSGL